MSQNDYTGLESYSNDELVSQAYHEFNDLVHPPIMMELAKRLEVEGDAAKQLAEIDKLEISIADIKQYADHIVDAHPTTINLLAVLSKHGIESSETLELILDAVSKIQNAA